MPMAKKQKSKPQLLAEALGTTSEKAKQFGDQVNQHLARGGHSQEPFTKICEVIRANPGRDWNANAVADALRNPKTTLSNLPSAGASPKLSNVVRVPVADKSLPSGSVRLRLSETDEAEVPQLRQRLSAIVDEREVTDGRSDPKTALREPTAASTPTHSPDAPKIRQFVADRKISYLVHLTKMENFRGICRAGAILSVNELKLINLAYEAFDTSRLDGHLDFINCSIGYHNFHMFYGAVSKSRTHDVLLLVRPDYLWFSETRFCSVNAATRRGAYVGSGFAALTDMYADRVDDNVGSQIRDGKPEWLPTSIQAEVLVYQSIPIEDILSVVLRDAAYVSMVRQAGWTGKVTAQMELFDYQESWLSRTHRPWFELD